MRLQLVSDQVRKILRSMKNGQNHYGIMANDAKKHCFADLNRDLLATDQRPGASELPLALNTGWFLEGVDRDTLAGQSCPMAQPLRALLDMFCLRKIDYPGIRSLTEGMRIDEHELASIDRDDLERMRPVYQHKRMDTCISAMQRELKQ